MAAGQSAVCAVGAAITGLALIFRPANCSAVTCPVEMPLDHWLCLHHGPRSQTS
ncbi:hypothetical protein FKM82_013008 [Ascaphus truei]